MRSGPAAKFIRKKHDRRWRVISRGALIVAGDLSNTI